MSTYADALKYFREKLKAGPEPSPVVEREFEKRGQTLLGERVAERPDVRPVPTTPDVQEPTPVSDPEFITLPDGTKRRIKPQEPTGEIYEWSHLMDYSSFRVKTPWRQQQLIAQWKENEALGGKHVNLRGGPKNKTCFRGCPSYQCTCEDNL